MGLGAAVGIGAVASIGGAALSSSAQKKAAKKAAKVEADNTAANNALAREMYANNASRLDPYSANGMRASNALTDMLLGPAQQPWQPGTPGGQGVPQVNPGPPQTNPLYSQTPDTEDYGLQPGQHLIGRPHLIDRLFHRSTPGTPTPTVPSQGTGAPGTGAIPSGQSALSPWDQFRNSTNYQWRLDQGNKGINQAYAARGTLQSGAAQKGLLEYNQNFAANELGRYQDLLAGQQGMGLTAASALAGVGQNMVGQVTANNNAAASAAANAALARGQATSNLYGGIASGIGQIAGAFGSSYGF